MAEVEVIEEIAAPARNAWALLTDFGGVKVGGAVEAVEFEGEGVGAVRTLTMGGGQVVERLDVYDEEVFTYAYSIVNEDSPQPVSSYASRIIITPDGDNCCTVNWSATFEPKGADEATVVEHFRRIYVAHLERVREQLS